MRDGCWAEEWGFCDWAAAELGLWASTRGSLLESPVDPAAVGAGGGGKTNLFTTGLEMHPQEKKNLKLLRDCKNRLKS